ncbi:glycosyltransferase [Hanstruepera ponticola]|uniref:glycosyltransferase n=1 Tax=Hanstruepera ponticola TaxID=2042995 RepID=UPI000CF18052|nr:glycosyltransferase [Hanstruepera ponticola]
MVLSLLFYVFIVLVCFQILYFLIVFTKISFHKALSTPIKELSISVIVCAKNEEENLKNFLPSILEQNYANFEVVLINDASHDDSLLVMEDFANKYKNIKIVNVKNNEAFWANKKYALTLGIKASKHPYLLFIDADCKPRSNNWIREMSSQFQSGKNIVLGYGAYTKIKNSLLNKLIRFETMLTAMQYFSWAKIGIPYMGVGRNLAYTKNTFFEASGFMSHMHIKSGDDDLFINQIANSENTAISLSPDSFTISTPKTSFKDWINQKKRHITTANHYKTNHKFILAFYYLSQLGFWLLSILLLILLFKWEIVLTLFLLRILIQYVVFFGASKKLDEKDIIFFLPFFDFFLVAFQLTIFISNLISKPRHWK